VQTKQEILDEAAKDNASSGRIFGAVIITVLAMTCIGMITNQLIGFEGRKKECAVMLSTSMNRRKLSGLLFREMLITSVISATLGAVEGSFLLLVIKAAVENSESLMIPNMRLPLAFVAAIWLGMAVLFALTVLFPIKNMKKMKLSEQLKYE
jgi:ABC-type antimicrobial peptide transport system permease subunit